MDLLIVKLCELGFPEISNFCLHALVQSWGNLQRPLFNTWNKHEYPSILISHRVSRWSRNENFVSKFFLVRLDHAQKKNTLVFFLYWCLREMILWFLTSCFYLSVLPRRKPLHKKWNFSLSISSVNVTKSAEKCGFGHIYWRNS